MKQPLINKLYLIFINWICKFPVHKIQGGLSATLLRLFSFKDDNQIDRSSAVLGDETECLLGARATLGPFLCTKFKEYKMLYSKSARAKLGEKLSVLSVAVTGAVSKIKEVEGLQSLNAKGIQIAFDEFQTELNQFIENHSLYPANEEKIRTASRKLNYQFNWMLNGIIENINILPRGERMN